MVLRLNLLAIAISTLPFFTILFFAIFPNHLTIPYKEMLKDI